MRKTSPLIKAMRLIIYVLGFVSIFLVMFMAQRLEQRLNNLEKRWLEVRKNRSMKRVLFSQFIFRHVEF